jgi:hypothetical protein
MIYVTYDSAGNLTGAYIQDLHPDHELNHIEVTQEQHAEWYLYRANAARDGVELAPVVAPVAAPLSLDDYRNAIQRHLDAKAHANFYDDIKSAALRAGYPGPFHAEGVRYAQWMDACWAKGYDVLNAVENGTRPAPTLAQLINELPEFV